MTAISSCARGLTSFECRTSPSEIPSAGYDKFSGKVKSADLQDATVARYGLSSIILKFPPNLVRQLSTKARRNCSNIGLAQVVAASWSTNQGALDGAPPTKVVDSVIVPFEIETGLESMASLTGDTFCNDKILKLEGSPSLEYTLFLKSDGSVVIHAGERLGHGIVTYAITTPIVNTSAYFFNKTTDLIDFKEKRRASFEYGRYGNYTTIVAEEKISALERAESTILMASGMCASTVMLMALVPACGYLVTTTDCYRKTRIFIEIFLLKMGITAEGLDVGLSFSLNKYCREIPKVVSLGMQIYMKGISIKLDRGAS